MELPLKSQVNQALPLAASCDAKASRREMKARQAQKIQELRESVFQVASGLREQAELLGLGRSTAWKVLHRPYKHSGLTAGVLNRILASPKLPPRIREIAMCYIAEKGSGLYGHNPRQQQTFASQIEFNSAEANLVFATSSLTELANRIYARADRGHDVRLRPETAKRVAQGLLLTSEEPLSE